MTRKRTSYTPSFKLSLPKTPSLGDVLIGSAAVEPGSELAIGEKLGRETE